MILKKILTLIFIFVLLYTPALSIADDYLENDFIENYQQLISVSSNLSKIPDINAKHAIVLDRASNSVLFGKNENEKCKMASTTKIMTAIVVIEKSNLNEIVTISKKAASVGGSRLGLSTNDKISIENLLYGLLLRSGNDAAVALAEYVGGSVENFANMMNDKASTLGLESTHFVTPHGLDNENHYTTAYELALITNYALKNDVFSKIVKTKNYTITINDDLKQLQNTNELLDALTGVYGVKTGFTNGANRCLVTSCKRNDLDIICVVLGCDTKKDRTLDSIKLINYIFDNYSVIDLVNIISNDFEDWYKKHSTSFYIDKSISSDLILYYDKTQIPFEKIAVNNSLINSVYTSISVNNNVLKAPLFQNTKIGKIAIFVDNETLFSIDILNQNIIYKKNITFYFNNFIKNYSHYLSNNFKF